MIDRSTQTGNPELPPQPVRRPVRRQPTEQTPSPKPPARAGRDRLFFTLSLIALTVAFAIVVLAGGTLIYYYSGRGEGAPALPQVPLLVDRPATRTAERVAALRSEWPWRTIVLDAGFKTWTVPPEQLGVRLDIEATVQQASAGEQAPAGNALLVTRDGTAYTPVWSFDRAAAEARLSDLAAEIEIKAQDAGVRMVGSQVETTEAKAGRALDVAATLATLAGDPWGAVQAGRLTLAVVPVEPTVRDASPVVAKASAWLAAPITLNLYDPLQDEHLTWNVEPAVLAGWLAIGRDAGDAAKLDCQVDTAKVEAYLLEQMKALGPERYLDLERAVPVVVEAVTGQTRAWQQRIYHRDRQHTVQSGETLSSIAEDYGVPYPWIQQANPDLGDMLRAGETITIPSQDALLPLLPVENKRIVVSLSQQRLVAYEDGKVKWDWTASTGIASSPTAPGIFQIQSHELNAYASSWNLWMPNFMGVYRPVPTADFMNGFHGFPSRDNKQLLWTGDLGHRVTYGCILVSTDNAKLLYDWADNGVVVEIQR